jgi:hypothetical protein
LHFASVANACHFRPVRLTCRDGRVRREGAMFFALRARLTAEWIGANLEQHKKAPPSYKCPLDVDGGEYKVAPGKTGFWVQLSAPSAEGAQEVLDRSRALIR